MARIDPMNAHASQRNMERAGLRTAYTKVVWVQQGR
jgi:hypothetical protein